MQVQLHLAPVEIGQVDPVLAKDLAAVEVEVPLAAVIREVVVRRFRVPPDLLRVLQIQLRRVPEEARNTSFCPLQEEFDTFVLRGLRNISEAP